MNRCVECEIWFDEEGRNLCNKCFREYKNKERDHALKVREAKLKVREVRALERLGGMEERYTVREWKDKKSEGALLTVEELKELDRRREEERRDRERRVSISSNDIFFERDTELSPFANPFAICFIGLLLLFIGMLGWMYISFLINGMPPSSYSGGVFP